MLEEERGQGRLEQGGEDVPVAREPVELVRRDVTRLLGQAPPEVELTRDDGAARARDDVRADLREPSLREVGVALVKRARDGELEDAVAEDLQPLVRRRAVVRPGAVREDRPGALVGQLADQAAELAGPDAASPGAGLTGAT